MKLVALGINHHTAPVDVREAVWLSPEASIETASRVRRVGWDEAFILSTCHRTEVFAVQQQDPGMSSTDELARGAIEQLLVSSTSKAEVRKEHIFLLHDYHALRHMFRIATGIDSLMIGDMQILGQFKEAAFAAAEARLIGSVLQHVVQSTLHAAKRVRTETALMEGAVSISYAAVELARKIFSDLADRRVLLVGAGQTGELAARHFSAKGVTKLTIINRTRSKAEELATSLGGEAADYDSLDEQLARVDIAVTSVASPDPILTKERLRPIMKRRENAPLVLVDIGMPRNVEPAAASIDSVFLYDIDNLQVVVDQNRARRAAELPRVNAIVQEELRSFKEWVAAQEAKPLIVDLRNHFESVRSEVVEQHIVKFAPEERELVQLITRRIVQRLLHLPMVELRNGQDLKSDERKRRSHLVRRMFGLERPEEPPHTEPTE